MALEHVAKGDVHNARFGLMLTDNAVELVLHQIAKDKASRLKAFQYLKKEFQYQAALEKAMGRSFDSKVKFAKIEGKLSEEEAGTINIMHGFRNEVYHVGIQHEAILPSLAVFHFDVACSCLGRYEPNGLGWGSNQKLPERSKKYFHGHSSFPGSMDDFPKACAALAAACRHDPDETIQVLADHMDGLVAEQDTCIGIVSDGVYVGQQTTRDKVVIDTQAWPLAFSEEGLAFAQERNWSGNRLQLVEWLAQNYPVKWKGDPIASWQKRVAGLRAEKNPHAALAKYHSFISETAGIREALMESAQQVENEIDAAVDRARGK